MTSVLVLRAGMIASVVRYIALAGIQEVCDLGFYLLPGLAVTSVGLSVRILANSYR